MELKLKDHIDDYVKLKSRHDTAIEERDLAIQQCSQAKQDVASTEKHFADMLM